MAGKNLTSSGIIQTLEGRKAELSKYDVRRIGLFGSFMRDSPRKGSDIDIIVSFAKPSFDHYTGLKSMLEGLFGRKIDLVTEPALKPALRHIKDEALYARL